MLLTIQVGHATIKETPEGVVVGNLASIIRIYKDSNGGTFPTSWDQIKTFYDLELLNQRLAGRDSCPIERHYQFFSPPQLPMPGGEVRGHVLLLRTVPLGDRNEIENPQKKLFRYVIYLRGDGEILTLSIPEVEVQKMLKSAGLTITPAAGLPAVEYDTLAVRKEEKKQGNKEMPNSPALQDSSVNSVATPPRQANLASMQERAKVSWTKLWVLPLSVVAVAVLGLWFLRRRKS